MADLRSDDMASEGEQIRDKRINKISKKSIQQLKSNEMNVLR